MKRITMFTAALVLLVISGIDAQHVIKGTVKDADNGETLIGAAILIDGTTKGAISNLDGEFEIAPVQEGTYKLAASLIGYETIYTTVAVSRDTELHLQLKSASKELSGANITAARITATENAVLAEMRNAEQVMNGVSYQQMSKTQDRVASDVLRRIPGITVVEDKFIMVRGLSDRYNVVLLNDAVAPSVEPDRKSFSFDLIPSGLLDRILIYKTGAPELPGEFTGGAIKIFTRNIPDENTIQFSYSASYHSAVTFRDYYKGEQEKNDWLGFDGGERSLPAAFPEQINEYYYGEDLSKIGQMLPNSWSMKRRKAAPDQRLGVLLAKSFAIGKVKAGTITSLNYSKVTDMKARRMANFNEYNQALEKSELIYEYNDTISSEKVSIGVINNWSFLLGANHKIEFQNMLNQSGLSQSLVREGRNLESYSYFRNYSIRYNQRTLYTGQLSGEHDIRNTRISWIAGVNAGNTKDPDYRRYQTNRHLDKPGMPFTLVVAPSYSLDQLGRFYSDLFENTFSGGVNLEQKLTLNNGDFEPRIRAGVFYEQKNRDFDARWLSYIKSLSDQFDNSILSMPIDQAMSMQNINPVSGFKISEGTNFHDSYENYGELSAGYLGVSLPVNSKVNVSGGFRAEDHLMEQRTHNDKGDPEVTRITTFYILPSANVSYSINGKSLVRAAYFKSLNRPEFREIERYSYFDFIRNELLKGNPDLKTAEVNNADLRWEYYPSEGEMVSAGVFYKEFRNPIERYSSSGAGGGTRSYSLGNAEGAQSIGAEFEIRKSLQNYFSRGLLKKLSLTLNASYIYSLVDLGPKAVYQDSERPMMDQSPYMVNGGIFYNDYDKQWQFSVMYNVIGRRLYAVGSDRSQPDIYEMPRHLVDASVTKGIGKHLEVKVGVKDVFNNRFRFMQDVNGDGRFEDSADQTLESFRPGSYYTAGLVLKF